MMELRGFRLATIRGVPVRIHFTFLLVLPFLAIGFARAFRLAAVTAGVPPDRLAGSPWLWGFAVAVALFASVLVHELAHALYARAKGGRVQSITLLMIGGVTQVSEPPRAPRDEALMALAGPLVSLGLGALFYGAHRLAVHGPFELSFGLFYLGTLNVFLGVFNLLPAFPMDGGRVLRAVLAGRMGAVRATHVAALVGKVFAVLFAIWGFLTFNMLLLLIAFFVFVGAAGESRAVAAKALLGGLHVRDVMNRQTLSIPAEASVMEAGERMLNERVLSLSVLSEGRPVGVLTLDALQGVPVAMRAETRAGDVSFATAVVGPDDDVATALRLMGESDLPQLPVASPDGQLVGTITRDDVARTLKLGQLEKTQHAGPGWPSGAHPSGAK